MEQEIIISGDPFACPVRPRTALEIRLAEIVRDIQSRDLDCRGCGSAAIVLHRLLAALASGHHNELAVQVAAMTTGSLGMELKAEGSTCQN